MKNYKFCPYCGSPATRKKTHLSCKSCGKKVYFKSTPSVGVFIIKDNKVLLAKRGIEPKKGFYDFIGGFLNMGEHPLDGAKREIWEETGLKIKNLDYLANYINKEYTYQGERVFPLDNIYVAEIASGKPKPKDDVSELKWFPIERIPKYVAFDTVKRGLEDLQKWYDKNKTKIND